MKMSIVLLLLLSQIAQADQWGTLFFTPAQRAKNAQVDAPEPNIPASDEHAPESRYYNGVLQTPRKTTHWVNGQTAPAPTHRKPGEMLAHPD